MAVEVELFSDTFDTTIGPGWDNGPSVANPYTANGSGGISPSSAGAGAQMIRNGESYANDHWSEIVVASHGDTILPVVSVVLRWTPGSGTVEHLLGVVGVNAFAITHKYEIIEFTDLEADEAVVLATAGTAGNLPANSKVKGWAEGTALTLFTDEGAGYVSRLATSDASIPSGVPGLSGYQETSATGTVITSARGGNLVPGVVTQEGFRWYNDDGDEDGSTAAGDQDANIVAPTGANRILRVLLQAEQDPASTEFTSRRRKNGTGSWTLVPVGSSGPATPAVPTSTTPTTIGSATDPWAINRPAAVAGDMVVFCLAWDDSTNVTSVTPPAGPNGETAVSLGGPVGEDGAPDHRQQAWYYIATGTWTTGTLSFDPSASETARCEAFVIPAGTFDATTPIGAAATLQGGTAGTTATSPTFSAGSTDGGGRLFVFWGKDTASNFTAPGSNWTTTAASNGGGVGVLVGGRNAEVSNSESIGALSATLSSETWACIAWIVRAPTVQNELYISPSANITNGEATTSRLAGGAGSFGAGVLNDTANGITVNIGEDDHTEIGWCLQMNGSAGLTPGDYFEVLVYNGETALDGTAARITVGAEGTDIEAALDTLAITEQPATVKLSRAVAAALDALVISEQPAAITLAKQIAAALDALNITEQQALVGLATEIAAATDALTITELAAVVRLGKDIIAGTDPLTITEQVAAIALARHVSGGTDALTITEQAAQVGVSRDIAAGLDTLTITEQVAVLAVAKSVAATFDALAITEYAATVQSATGIAAGLDALVITERTATVNRGVNLGAGLDALVLTEFGASVRIGKVVAAGLDALTISEQVATLALARHIAAAADSLVITERPASVQLASGIAAAFDQLAIAEHAASIALAKAVAATPDALTITERQALITLAKDISAGVDALAIVERQALVQLGRAVLAGTDQLAISEHPATVEGVAAILLSLARRFVARAPRGAFSADAPQSEFRAQGPRERFRLN